MPDQPRRSSALAKIAAIASREYASVVKTRAFLISVILLPLMMFGSILMQKVAHDTSDKTFAVIDRTDGQKLFSAIKDAVDDRNKRSVYDKAGKKVNGAFLLERIVPAKDAQRQRLELSKQIDSGQIFGFLEVGHDVLKPDAADVAAQRDNAIIRYTAKTTVFTDFRSLVQGDLLRRFYLSRAGLFAMDPQKLADLLIPPLVINKGLLHEDTGTGQVKADHEQNEATAILLPLVSVLMMFMIVLVSSIPMMQVVMEEKQQRIVEVLLGSVTPTQLMVGKLVGMVGTSGTLLLIYLTGAWWALHRMDMQDYVSTSLLIWFVILTMLAVTMFGSLYVAVGAAVQDIKEAQSLVLPVNLMIMIPMFLLVNVLENPARPMARFLTLFPTTAPMITIARMAVRPGISPMETASAVAMTLLGAFICVFIAGRIFRVGILMQGKRPTLGLLLRWIISPERRTT